MHRLNRVWPIVLLIVPIVVATPVLESAPSAAVQPPPGTANATVTELDGLDGCNPAAPRANVARAINAGGVAVGHVEGCYPNFAVPFLPDSLAVRFNPTSVVHLVHSVNWSPFEVLAYELAGEALSINDAGVVSGAGNYGFPFISNSDLYAFPGGWLPRLPGAVNQYGGYINNAGEVVGTTFFDSLGRTPAHATLWVVGGSPIDLGTFNGISIFPLALAPNLSGPDRVIVGYYYPSSPNLNILTAVMWRNGEWSELPGPPGCDRNYTVANDVSDDGIIVGNELYCWNTGVLWENGQIRSLSPECQLAGIGEGWARLNGIAVTPGGRHIIAGTCNEQPVVFYDDARGNYTAERLPLLPGDSLGEAVDVNPSGQVVGRTYTFGGQSHPVRWDVTLPSVEPGDQPPQALCQARTVSADASCRANASIDAGSFDPNGGAVTSTQDPVGPYPLGNTLVELTVTNNHGESAICMATVSVVDDTPPLLTCPLNLNLGATSGGGAPASFALGVSDNCPAGPLVGCSHSSGSIFPVGTTVVTCSASDGSGNNDGCSFGVTVLSAEQQTVNAIAELQHIIDQNTNTPLADEIEDALSKAQRAANELTKTPPDNQAAVRNIKGAVGDIEAAVDNGLLDAAVGAQLMDHLTAIGRLLAVIALEDATVRGGDPAVLNEAQQALHDGDALRASGAFEGAVNRYKHALARAEKSF